MTGFLQRLAQRANGAARTVRAAPGARFAPEPLGHGTPLQEEAPAPDATAPFQPAGTPPGAGPSRFSDPVFSPAEARRQQVAETPRRGQTTATRSNPDPLLAPADEAAAAPSPARTTHTKTPMPTPGTPDTANETRAVRNANPATSTPATPKPDTTSSTPPSNSEPPAWRQVEPLLAPAIRVRWPASAALPPLSHRPSQGGPADTTTEVHVSIGRIEVTAIHEPAAPAQRPAARRKAPVSLDEYLARRQGGRS
ncbi:MAG: hypothetical protein U1C47_19540 [Hydrogenophaga sp.]|jgi:hypothetical protein|nr:hypothetical protein [Hydrogenophaga sp.]